MDEVLRKQENNKGADKSSKDDKKAQRSPDNEQKKSSDNESGDSSEELSDVLSKIFESVQSSFIKLTEIGAITASIKQIGENIVEHLSRIGDLAEQSMDAKESLSHNTEQDVKAASSVKEDTRDLYDVLSNILDSINELVLLGNEERKYRQDQDREKDAKKEKKKDDDKEKKKDDEEDSGFDISALGTGAVAALTAGLIQSIKENMDDLAEFFDAFMTEFKELWENTANYWSEFFSGMTDWLAGIKDFWSNTSISELLSLEKQWISDVLSVFTGLNTEEVRKDIAVKWVEFAKEIQDFFSTITNMSVSDLWKLIKGEKSLDQIKTDNTSAASGELQRSPEGKVVGVTNTKVETSSGVTGEIQRKDSGAIDTAPSEQKLSEMRDMMTQINSDEQTQEKYINAVDNFKIINDGREPTISEKYDIAKRVLGKDQDQGPEINLPAWNTAPQQLSSSDVKESMTAVQAQTEAKTTAAVTESKEATAPAPAQQTSNVVNNNTTVSAPTAVSSSTGSASKRVSFSNSGSGQP